jgi:hypothetical protein
LCLAGVDPLPGLALLMRGEFRLAAESHALRLRAGTAARGAFGDAAAFELRRNPKHGKDKFGKIGRRIDNWLGNRTQARAGALHVAGDDQKVGRVTRDAVNGGDDDNIAVIKDSHHLSKLRPVGGGAGDLLAEHLFAAGSLQLGKLAGEVLGIGRDASIAVNHARIVDQKYVSQKRNSISSLVFNICTDALPGGSRLRHALHNQPNPASLKAAAPDRQNRALSGNCQLQAHRLHVVLWTKLLEPVTGFTLPRSISELHCSNYEPSIDKRYGVCRDRRRGLGR